MHGVWRVDILVRWPIARRTLDFRAPTALRTSCTGFAARSSAAKDGPQRPRASTPQALQGTSRRRRQPAPPTRSGALVLVSPAGSDKIVRPRLAAPLFPMHTFYQLGLQQQLCKPLLIPLVSSIDSIAVRDHVFALNLASQHAPVPWNRTSSHPPVLAWPAPWFTEAFFPPTHPVWGLRDPHQLLFAALFQVPRGRSWLISLNRLPDFVQSAAALASLRRRRTRRRASQELTKKQALTA